MKSSSPLVSVIIPTYNRAHLIGETLDSIIAQTYVNWECIVVDDGSTDNTDTVMQRYIEEDARIQYHHRPEAHLPGGNGARNYGLNLATGKFVVFFDSDDLMTKQHIQVKVEAIKKENVDYVIAKTEFYNSNKNLEHNYTFDTYEINVYNYITQAINWLTYDVLIDSTLSKSISFNENLKSGQEYNYFSKLVLKSNNAFFIDKILTQRRYHENSIRTNLTKLNAARGSFKSMFSTYIELRNDLNDYEKKGLMFRMIKLVYKHPKIINGYFLLFYKELRKVYKSQSFNFILMLLFNKINKGYVFRQKLKDLSIHTKNTERKS